MVACVYAESVMDRYFTNNFTMDNSVDESSPSACALSSEAGEKMFDQPRNTNSEIDLREPVETAVPSAKYAPKVNCNKSKRIKAQTFKSTGQGDLLASSTGSFRGPRTGKKRRVYGNGREVSRFFSSSDSEDDFKETMHRVPSTRQTHKTSKDGQASTSHQALPYTYSSTDTSDKVPVQSEHQLGPFEFDDLLPSASVIQESHVPNIGVSADGDEFGVHGLVDSFLGDLSPSARRRNAGVLNSEVTNSQLRCSEMKGTKNKHKPSSFSASYGARNADEVQSNAASDDFADFFDDIQVNSNTGNSEDTETLTVPNGGRVESILKKYRFRHGDNFFDRTFEVPDAPNERMSQVGLSQSSSMAFFTDGTLTNSLEGPRSVLNTKPRSEKLACTSRPTYLIATQSKTQSAENSDSCISSMGVARMSTMGSSSKDCYRGGHQGQTGKLPATGSSMSDERGMSESATSTSNPFHQKRRGIDHTSSLAGTGCSTSAILEADIQQNAVTSSLSISDQSRDVRKDKRRHSTSRSRYQLPTPAVENTSQSSAIVDGDEIHGRDKLRNYQLLRKRSRSRTGSQSRAGIAAAVPESESDAQRLKRKPLYAQRTVSDNSDSGEASFHTPPESVCTGRDTTRDGNSSRRHEAESAIAFDDCVVVINSDDEVRSPTRYPAQRIAADSSDGQQRSNLEPSSSAAEAGNSERLMRRKRTARMSTGGG